MGEQEASAGQVPVRPLRAVLLSLLGGVVGAAVVGYLAGQVVSAVGEGESGAWAALGAAIVGAAVGAFVGAALALYVGFRDEPPAARRTTALVVLLGGPVLLLAIGAVASRIEQDWNVPPLWLALALLLAALLGRWVAARRGRTAGSHPE